MTTRSSAALRMLPRLVSRFRLPAMLFPSCLPPYTAVSAYYITFFRKIKEVFCLLNGFFQDLPRKTQRKQEEAGKIHHRIRPEVPHRREWIGEDTQIEQRAAPGPCRRESPQFPVRRPEQEGEQRRAQSHAIGQVQCGGQTRQTATEGAERVIGDSGAQAQQDGLEEQQELHGNPDPHTVPVYPKSRLRNPPRSCPPSS